MAVNTNPILSSKPSKIDLPPLSGLISISGFGGKTGASCAGKK
jgi:hypothetical protein